MSTSHPVVVSKIQTYPNFCFFFNYRIWLLLFVWDQMCLCHLYVSRHSSGSYLGKELPSEDQRECYWLAWKKALNHIENLWSELKTKVGPQKTNQSQEAWESDHWRMGWDCLGDGCETCWKLQQRTAGCYPAKRTHSWLLALGFNNAK